MESGERFFSFRSVHSVSRLACRLPDAFSKRRALTKTWARLSIENEGGGGGAGCFWQAINKIVKTKKGAAKRTKGSFFKRLTAREASFLVVFFIQMYYSITGSFFSRVHTSGAFFCFKLAPKDGTILGSHEDGSKYSLFS